jgi:nucleotide-binding universal stress UspA family protein
VLDADKEAIMYHKILVPLDGSPRGEQILPHVAEMARRYQAEVIFLQVLAPEVIITDPYQGLAYMEVDALFEQHEKEATAYLTRWQTSFKGRNIAARVCVERGGVVNTIIEVAEREGVDLIAMSSHGRTGLTRVFYGSVAAGVLHRVDRPLLLIRSQDE